MPLHKLSDLIDEWYPSGTPERREFEYYGARTRRIMDITGFVYRTLILIPPRWSTHYDEQFQMKTNWRGVGPVAAQFWSDILEGVLWRFEHNHNDRLPYKDEGGRTFGDIFYSALDGLAWRFMNDEYVPTWTDVKTGKSGRKRWGWRMRRRHHIEMAEHTVEQLRESGELAS